MKHYLIGFLLLLCFHLTVHSQVYPHTISVTGGRYGFGYGGEVTYNNNLSENSFTQIALNATFTNFKEVNAVIPYYSFTGSYSYFLTVWSRNRKRQALSLGGGAMAGYESANNGQDELSNIISLNGKSKFIFGAVVTADLDIILSDEFSAVIKTSQFYHINSDFGKFTNYSGIGIRYYFN